MANGFINDDFTADGMITGAKQPWALVKPSAERENVTGDGTAYTIDYGTEIKDQNNDMSGTTFTAPVAGGYLTCLTNQTSENYGAGYTRAKLVLATSNRSYILVNVDPDHVSESAFGNLGIGGAMVADMDAADIATTAITVNGPTKSLDVDTGDGTYWSIGKIF